MMKRENIAFSSILETDFSEPTGEDLVGWQVRSSKDSAWWKSFVTSLNNADITWLTTAIGIITYCSIKHGYYRVSYNPPLNLQSADKMRAGFLLYRSEFDLISPPNKVNSSILEDPQFSVPNVGDTVDFNTFKANLKPMQVWQLAGFGTNMPYIFVIDPTIVDDNRANIILQKGFQMSFYNEDPLQWYEYIQDTASHVFAVDKDEEPFVLISEDLEGFIKSRSRRASILDTPELISHPQEGYIYSFDEFKTMLASNQIWRSTGKDDTEVLVIINPTIFTKRQDLVGIERGKWKTLEYLESDFNTYEDSRFRQESYDCVATKEGNPQWEFISHDYHKYFSKTASILDSIPSITKDEDGNYEFSEPLPFEDLPEEIQTLALKGGEKKD